MLVSRVEFRILGPLEVLVEGRPIRVGGGRQRALLAMLLLEAGRVVPVARLAAAMWDDDPPVTAREQVQNSVSAIRRVLTRAGGPEALITTEATGYRLHADADQLDAAVFEERLAQARTAVTDDADPARAARLLRLALELWRGPALAGVGGRTVESAAARWNERRLAAMEERIELDLRLGRHADVVAELAQLVGEHPGRERLVGQSMRALHRCGRSADALAVFQVAKKRLADEFGLDPGSELRELELAILRDEPDLARPEPVRAPVPRQLPPDITGFTGRETHLHRLTELLNQPAEAPPVLVIAGVAGVGKTALTVHWANRVADRFPDGQLHVNLRGHSPDPALKPELALDLLLRGLGVPGEQIPPGLAARTALYRTLLADKRILVTLDNARSAEQVRPLLPGSPSCLVVITSRDTLAGLVALDGAQRIDLDVLSRDEAVALLSGVLGSAWVRAEPLATKEFVELCGRLPLAIRIAAAKISTGGPAGASPIADHVRELRTDRLDTLALDGDREAMVRTHFDHSYRALDASQRRLFRLLGMVPGTDFTVHAAAALTGGPLEQAKRQLARLAGTHLIESTSPHRYHFHDLLRLYAVERANAEDSQPERDAALHRLFDWYLRTGHIATHRIDPSTRVTPIEITTPIPDGPELDDHRQALDWLEAERANLLAAIDLASARRMDVHAWQIPHAIWTYLCVRGFLTDWTSSQQLALAAAQRLGDLWAQGQAHSLLAVAHGQSGRYVQAAHHFQRSLTLCRRTGDDRGAASALGNLGNVYERWGRYQKANHYYQEALPIRQRAGDRRGIAVTLLNIGSVHVRLGHHRQGLETLRHALALYRQVSDLRGVGMALLNLGIVYHRLAEYDKAIDHGQEALALQQEIGDRAGQAYTISTFGNIYRQLGKLTEALGYHHEALGLVQQIGGSDLDSEIHNDTGETQLAVGDAAAALDHHRHALAVASDSGHRFEHARAHYGLALALHTAGSHAEARTHWVDAAAMYTELGVPEAERLATQRAALRCDCLSSQG